MSNLETSTASLDSALSALRVFESDLIQMDSLDDYSTEDILQLASDLHLAKSLVGDLFNELQTRVTDHLGSLPIPVAVDGATIEIKAGSPRKTWDHDSLINDVTKRIVDSSIDLNTGEVVKTTPEMIKEALAFAGISYWKVTKLKELHLDADEYCEVGEAKKNLVIRRNK